MERAKIIFGDRKVNRKDFYSARESILLNKVDVGKIIVSDEIIVDNNKKFVIGDKNDDIIMPLSVQLPQVDGYIKYFKSGATKMSFLIKENDKVLYTLYSKIWKKISSIMKVKFTMNPIYDETFIGARLKTFGEQNSTIFTDNDDVIVKMPKENVRYACIPIIDVDSVYKVDSDESGCAEIYAQIYLRQCKYRTKKLRFKNYITDELLESSDDE